ncbi:MAG TPA: hypothetical protein ENN29_01665 [Candidatus Hydrogenedentes bacterium]|nr:hypothetical protein [Candidatus Hydrogenedentota bacterium]
MFFAVIGDIKSNFCGLQQVLRALEDAGIHRVLHTGNVCETPANARECVALLRRHTVLSVQGKKDRDLVRRTKRPRNTSNREPLAQTHQALDSAAKEHLRSLPRKRRFSEEGLQITLCHGSVNCSRDLLTSDTPLERFRREREQEPADIIIYGGAARPFAFTIDHTLFACPGTMMDESGRLRYLLVNTENTVPTATSIAVP